MTLKKSPFFDFLNRRHDTDFEQYLLNSTEDMHYIDWNRYVLPGDYGDAHTEYLAIRNGCALFDVSPMRKYRIKGPDSGAFLDHLLTRPVSEARSMRGIYVVFCNEDGSLMDDAILYKYADDDYLLMPSDMDHSVHFETLCRHLGINDISIEDCTNSLVGTALQGPLSATVLYHMGLADIEHLEPFSIRDFPLSHGSIQVSRMGFTADLGYECWFSPDLAKTFEQNIRSVSESLGIDIPGYGLTALEVCRLEGGFIVAGWDCATEAEPAPGFERSPFELGLDWLVNLDAADFVGRDALLEQRRSGTRFTLRSFEISDQRPPPDGTGLFVLIDGEEIDVGIICCSAWSWDLDSMIGNASIKSRFADTSEAWTRLHDDVVKVKLRPGPPRRFARAKQVPATVNSNPI